jgi:MarC family membrane protein
VTQSLFDFSAYFKFFIGLFALVNPVGIIPVFISMTSYQPAAVRNKTNLTANLSVAIILLTSLFLGDGILQIFGISIDSFRIAGGILVVTIAMSMISGKLGEDKQNKQEKSETAVRESIGVVPLALPLMAGPGAISSTIVWGPVSLLGAPGRVLTGDCGICPLLLGDFPHGAVAGASAGADGNQRHHPYYGPAADGPRH